MTTDHNPNSLDPANDPVFPANLTPARTLPPRRPLSRRALLLAWALAIAVPVLFLLSAVAFMVATNFSLLEWME